MLPSLASEVVSRRRLHDIVRTSCTCRLVCRRQLFVLFRDSLTCGYFGVEHVYDIVLCISRVLALSLSLALLPLRDVDGEAGAYLRTTRLCVSLSLSLSLPSPW